LDQGRFIGLGPSYNFLRLLKVVVLYSLLLSNNHLFSRNSPMFVTSSKRYKIIILDWVLFTTFSGNVQPLKVLVLYLSKKVITAQEEDLTL